MKYFFAFALFASVASAAFIKPTVVSGQFAEVQQIAAAISSASTDPATGAALTQMLLELLGLAPEQAHESISIAPVFIESPAPAADGGAVTADEPVVAAPTPAVVIGDLPAGAAAPIVQIIVKVNQPEAVITPGAVAGETIVPGAVNWVDGPETAPVSPIQVIEPVVPGAVKWVDASETVEVTPVQVVEPVAPGAVNWVDAPETIEVSPVVVAEPIVVEPISIGAPIIPSPVVALPEILN